MFREKLSILRRERQDLTNEDTFQTEDEPISSQDTFQMEDEPISSQDTVVGHNLVPKIFFTIYFIENNNFS
jgi:hypothetical protein